ncbi:MAG: hypothetical protein ACRD2G_19840, partial [Terriglobia bacterium]
MRLTRRNSAMFSIKPKLARPSAINLTLCILLPALIAMGAVGAGKPLQQGAQSLAPRAQAPTPLATLVREAERDNPQILAARRAWQAATQVPSQVSTLPDPQLTVQ